MTLNIAPPRMNSAGLTLGAHGPSIFGKGTNIYKIPASSCFGQSGSPFPHLDSSCAVKVIRASPKDLEQIHRINNMLMYLSGRISGENQAYVHNGICPTRIVDARISIDGPPIKCLVTPWCVNGNILDCVNRGTTSTTRNLTWVMQIANALNHLHSYNVVHGNICPENILITDGGQAVIVDIRVYTLTTQMLLHPSGRLLVPHSALYKPSEELYPATDDVVQPSTSKDIYSFASTTYAIFAGCPPFSHFRTSEQAIRTIVRHGHQSLEKPADMPHALWSVLESCWESDPVARPRMSEVVNVLQSL